MKAKRPKPITGYGILNFHSNTLLDRFDAKRKHSVLVAAKEPGCRSVRVVMSVKRGGK